jgi:lysine-specific demethylase/histidyl-hydroxylase NO66
LHGSGIDIPTFLRTVFDKKHLHIRRDPHVTDFYSNADGPLHIDWSTERMRALVAAEPGMRVGTDINIVRYDRSLKKRVAFPLTDAACANPRVSLADYDRAMQDGGYSVRFLRPHEHVASVSRVIFGLEEELNCSCGANSYWTPPESQGFAPHYDDVDVFLLQLEGRKRWRLYDPPTDADVLSRFSSEDFSPEQLGKPIATLVMEPGDVLYMPRGCVHQGDTVLANLGTASTSELSQPQASLHVTLSASQMHTYADLLLHLYKSRIEFAAANNIELRRGLPVQWSRVLGSATNPKVMGPHGVPIQIPPFVPRTALSGPDADAAERAGMLAAVRKLCAQVNSDIQSKDGIVDKGADMLARDVLERRQPVPADPSHGTEVTNPTKIRLLARGAVRLSMFEGEMRLFHCGPNSAICYGPHKSGAEAQRAVFDDDDNERGAAAATPSAPIPTELRLDDAFAPAVAALIAAAPKALRIDQLPFPTLEDDADAEEDLAANRRLLVQSLLSTRCFIAE